MGSGSGINLITNWCMNFPQMELFLEHWFPLLDSSRCWWLSVHHTGSSLMKSPRAPSRTWACGSIVSRTLSIHTTSSLSSSMDVTTSSVMWVGFFISKVLKVTHLSSQEYYVIREYLVPGWLISVQFFVTVAFVLTMISMTVLSLVIVRWPLKAVLQYEWIFIRTAFICIAVSSLFMGLGVIVFGSCAYRRDWLMYPKFNVLSWSYGLAVISFIVLGLGGLILHREARNAFEIRGEAKNLVMQMEMQEPGFHQSRHHHSQSVSRSLQGYI